jgi:hypothetical protein
VPSHRGAFQQRVPLVQISDTRFVPVQNLAQQGVLAVHSERRIEKESHQPIIGQKRADDVFCGVG